MTSTTDWLHLGKEVLDIEIEALNQVRDTLDESFEHALHMMAQCTGRIVVTGLGKSGLIGRKIAATLSSTGTPAFFLHPVEGAHGDMGSLRQDDVVLAISNSGETAEILELLPAMHRMGLTLIVMSGQPQSSLARTGDIFLNIAVPREACPLNMAPTSSTTATLALGDALAVGLMRWKNFSEGDFLRFHPGGSLGKRMNLIVDTLMHTENIPMAYAHESQEKALSILDAGKLGAAMLVNEDKQLMGILTDGDIRRALQQKTFAPQESVSQIMTCKPRCGHSQQRVAELLDIMEGKAITVLPIVDEHNTLLGVVHLHDLLGKGGVRFAE